MTPKKRQIVEAFIEVDRVLTAFLDKIKDEKEYQYTYQWLAPVQQQVHNQLGRMPSRLLPKSYLLD